MQDNMHAINMTSIFYKPIIMLSDDGTIYTSLKSHDINNKGCAVL